MHRIGYNEDVWGLDSNLKHHRLHNGTDTLVDYSSASNRHGEHMTTFLRNKSSNSKTSFTHEGQQRTSTGKNFDGLTSNFLSSEGEPTKCFETKDGKRDVIQATYEKKKRKKKKTKKDSKSSRRNRKKGETPSISFEEFQRLDAVRKARTIKDTSKKMIKGFYKEIFIQNILKNFEQAIKEDPKFISESGFPFKIEEGDYKIVMKKGQYIKLFENPNFVPLCRKYMISVLDGEKYTRNSAAEKIAKTFEMTGRRTYELGKAANLRISMGFRASRAASFRDVLDRQYHGRWQMWGSLN